MSEQHDRTDVQTAGQRATDSLTRRGVVSGAVVAATATSLAACGSDESTTPTSSNAGAGSSSSAAGGSTGGSGGGAALTVETSKVPVGGGYVDEGTKIVVTQPTAGAFKAFSAVCPHEKCLVDQIENNVISCPCHGSEFDATSGEVKKGPAETGLGAKTATSSGGNVEVS